ncbi:MAG: DUF1080 domain-containing protein [Pirellulales bacterium]
MPRRFTKTSRPINSTARCTVSSRPNGCSKLAGEWNSQEITLQGRRIRVVTNGVTVVDADLDEAAAAGTLDGKEHPGLKSAVGHIGFLGHGDPVAYRNLRVKVLSAAK